MTAEIKTTVNIVGAFGTFDKPMSGMLNVEIGLKLDVHPKDFSPGMSAIVRQELHNAVDRMLEKVSKQT